MGGSAGESNALELRKRTCYALITLAIHASSAGWTSNNYSRQAYGLELYITWDSVVCLAESLIPTATPLVQAISTQHYVNLLRTSKTCPLTYSFCRWPRPSRSQYNSNPLLQRPLHCVSVPLTDAVLSVEQSAVHVQ